MTTHRERENNPNRIDMCSGSYIPGDRTANATTRINKMRMNARAFGSPEKVFLRRVPLITNTHNTHTQAHRYARPAVMRHESKFITSATPPPSHATSGGIVAVERLSTVYSSLKRCVRVFPLQTFSTFSTHPNSAPVSDKQTGDKELTQSRT